MSTSRPMNSDNETVSLLLDSLPLEVKEEIYSHCSPTTLGFFAQTSKTAELETAFFRLLSSAVYAEPESYKQADETSLAAIAILKKHPELLFRKGTVTDHFGRKIKGSPYQLLLGAGDIWALKQVHKDILPLIENGEGQAEVQFKEQFPNCPWLLPKYFSEEMLYDDRNKQQIEAIVDQLTAVKKHIEADPFNNKEPLDTTKQAVETLCKLFQPKPNEIIRSGLHFPLAIMKEIYKTYNTLQKRWAFFALAVIKPALDALSTVDGQCCQSGWDRLDMEKGPNGRCHSSYRHPLGKPLSLTLVNDKDKRGAAAIVDPYDGEVLFVSSSAPGYFDCFNKDGRRAGMSGGAINAASEAGLANLCRRKTGAYGGYHAATHRCVNTPSR